MGFATHLGPWLLGTVKNTTGTTAGSVQNMGGTVVAQTNSTSFAFAALFNQNLALVKSLSTFHKITPNKPIPSSSPEFAAINAYFFAVE